MAASETHHRSSRQARITATTFADLRLRNERAAEAAEMRAAKRERQIEQAIRAQRQRRVRRTP